ncbi:cytochrome P450 [Aspergillus avenaceus]|uniref:Cytochrome P450 n=1 Tax=Aspergillus avenaceus TaxID=36643 RepID=A0A5N6U6G3_ASPAV|nr:cytochrome P450 [Aspergillus avenaceus]
MASFLGSWLILVVSTVGISLYHVITSRPTLLFISSVVALEVISFVVWAFYWVVLYPVYFTPFRNIPTPPNRKLLTGNLDEFFPDYQWQIARNFYHTIPNNGLIRYYGGMSVERLLVTTPNALRDMLTMNAYDFGQSSTFKLLVKRVTGSTFSFTTDEVKVHRKHFMPAFTTTHIKEITYLFWDKCVQMTDGMEAQTHARPGVPISINDWGSRAALDNIGLAGMGYDFETLQKPDGELRRHYEKINVKPHKSLNWVGLLSNFMNLGLLLQIPFKKNREIAQGAKYVRSVASRVIHERKARLLASKGVTDRKDIISVALASGAFTPEQLVEYVMVFLSAGHESTAATFEWTIYELAQRPEMQQRLRAELREFAPKMDDINPTRLESLPYLNAVCSEALRFYPFTPMVVKVAERDSTIVGEHIPKGTLVAYIPMATNRDKAFWGSDAEVFNPDRWMEPGKAKSGGATSNYAMLSFSAGNRNCLGHAFARAELACLVASIVGRFDILLANPETAGIVDAGQVTRSKAGVHVHLKPVDGWL